MCCKLTFLICIALSFFDQTVFAGSGYTKKTFTVEDSIKMVKIVEPDAGYSSFIPSKIKMSPDGKYFIIVTRSGNPVTGKNDYILILYQSDDVLEFLNKDDDQKTTLPEGEILTKVSISSNDMPFQKLKWLEDSKTLAFIGWFDTEDGQSPGQIYKLDTRSGVIQKLTNHTRPITDFALTTSSQRIIFASSVSRHNKGRTKTSYLMDVMPVNGILDPDWENPYPAFRYYVQEISRPGQSLSVGKLYHGFFLSSIWLSPNGLHAVVLTTRKSAPRHWLEGYGYLKNSFYQSALRELDKNTMIPREDLANQFSLIDISKKTIRPVFDAPTGLYVGGFSVNAYWLPDSKSVILANTALPLDILNKKEKKQRSLRFSTIEYQLSSGTITPITHHTVKKVWRGPDMTENGSASSGQFHGLEMDTSGLLKIKQVNDRRENLPDEYFEKRDGEWIKVPRPSAAEIKELTKRIEVTIFQGLNSPPEIMALDVSTGHEKIITDFNPQFQNLTFGNVEVLNWKDRNGRNWRGGIVYPPGYKAGQKYPLVIQTHGFNPQDFLIDGPFGTASAFTAQALANQDIIVLQMGMPSVPPNRNALYISQKGFEAAIKYLDTKGLIDKKKVGLIGWSATGVDVQQMLLYSDYPVAAATIADSYNIGLFGYINQFGRPAPGMAYIESKLGGGVPWGKDLNKWVTNNPSLHLDRLKTPLRYEQYETGLSSWLDTYVFLKRQKKPVEYYVFNDAAHSLIKPQHRMASQQGNVDWFTFWLKGEEDPDPAKSNQYKRWRKLRIQQEKSEIAATQARKRDRKQKNSLVKKYTQIK